MSILVSDGDVEDRDFNMVGRPPQGTIFATTEHQLHSYNNSRLIDSFN